MPCALAGLTGPKAVLPYPLTDQCYLLIDSELLLLERRSTGLDMWCAGGKSPLKSLCHGSHNRDIQLQE